MRCKLCKRAVGNKYGYCGNCWNNADENMKKTIIKDREEKKLKKFSCTLETYTKD